MNPNIESALRLMEQEIKLRHYSPKTKKLFALCSTLFGTKGDLVLTRPILKNYLVQKLDSGAAPETVNLHLNAISFSIFIIASCALPHCYSLCTQEFKTASGAITMPVLQKMLVLTQTSTPLFAKPGLQYIGATCQ